MKCPNCSAPFSSLMIESDSELTCANCGKMVPAPAHFVVKRERNFFEVSWKESLSPRIGLFLGDLLLHSVVLLFSVGLLFALLPWFRPLIAIAAVVLFIVWMLPSFKSLFAERKSITLRLFSSPKDGSPYRTERTQESTIETTQGNFFGKKKRGIDVSRLQQLYTSLHPPTKTYDLVALFSDGSMLSLLSGIGTEHECRYIEEQLEARLQIKDDAIEPEKAPRPAKSPTEKPAHVTVTDTPDATIFQWRDFQWTLEHIGPAVLLLCFFVSSWFVLAVSLPGLFFPVSIGSWGESLFGLLLGLAFLWFSGYYLYSMLNKTIVSLRLTSTNPMKGTLSVDRGPSNRQKVEIFVEEIEQLYCCEDSPAGEDSSATYKLVAKTKTNTQTLFSEGTNKNLIWYIEEQLEARLQIEDKPMVDEIKDA